MGLAKATLIGRFQHLDWRGKQVILDVAHNPHAAKHSAQSLANETTKGRTIAVLAMLGDKDYQAVIGELRDTFDVWVLASTDGARALSSKTIANELAAQGVLADSVATFDSPVEAFNKAVTIAAEKDRIVVFGSFVTVGTVLEFVQNQQHNNTKGQA